jgi:hypothetical protein
MSHIGGRSPVFRVLRIPNIPFLHCHDSSSSPFQTPPESLNLSVIIQIYHSLICIITELLRMKTPFFKKIFHKRRSIPIGVRFFAAKNIFYLHLPGKNSILKKSRRVTGGLPMLCDFSVYFR